MLGLARRLGASTRPTSPVLQSPALRHDPRHLAAAPSLSSPPQNNQRRRHRSPSSISTSASSLSPPSPLDSAMPGDVRAALEALHARKDHKVVVYATGGAAQALSWLLTVPGASNTVLEARVPYGGARSWADALDSSSLPSSLASAGAAEALADAAYRQAARLSPFVPPESSSPPFDLVGVGCACALATGRDRKGSDRVFVAARVGSRGLYSASLAEVPRSSDPGSRSREREAQDDVASRLLLRTLGRAVGCDALSSLGLFPPSEATTDEARASVSRSLEEGFEEAEDPISALLSGRFRSVELGGGMPAVVDAPRGSGRVYLSGSFNPLHSGHVGLLDAAVAAAEGERGAPSPSPSSSPPVEGAFELSVVNADKGALTEEEVRRRVAQFDGTRGERRRRVVLTRAPLFEDKAALFGPGASFVVGVDTAVRLLDPKYYRGGSDAGLGVCMGRIAARGATVFVAGRKAKEVENGDGSEERFVTLQSSGALDATPAARVVASLGLFREIPEDKFREDISSTELRERAKREAAAEAASDEAK